MPVQTVTLPSGQRLTEEQAEAILTNEPIALSYRPRQDAHLLWGDGTEAPYGYVLADVDRMLMHGRVLESLRYYKAGIAKVHFTLKDVQPPGMEPFVLQLHERVWERSLTQIQQGYEYGRIGLEIVYETKNALLHFAGLKDFDPRDCRVLTDSRRRYMGFKVLNLGLDAPGEPYGSFRFWGADWAPPLPAKGFWFVHQPRFGGFYGRTQLLGAWKAWRRLATRDGAEEIVDGAIYRYGIGGAIVYYPPTDSPSGEADSESTAAKSKREKAREMGEGAKAGQSIGLPSIFDPVTGKELWRVEFPNHVLDAGPLDEHCHKLEQQISLGIGVPPELFEASEVGSGWSGRSIPLIGYYVGQRKNAQWLAQQIREQIGLPLCRWNFGPEAAYDIDVEIDMSLARELDKEAGQESPQAPMGARRVV